MRSDEETISDIRDAAAETSVKATNAKKTAVTSVGETPIPPKGPEIKASDFAFLVPPDFDIPAMITRQEKSYLYWLATNHATGAGAVVEIGPWLGASSACLAAALGERPLHCYDQFVWSRSYNTKAGVQLEHGADFSHLFTDNMKRIGANIVTHRTPIKEAKWDGSPIELLIIDAPKYADPLIQVLNTFAPSLIPGGSRIVFQNYQYFQCYQIAVVLDSVRENLALEHVVIDPLGKFQTNSVGFKVIAPLDLKAAAEAAKTFKTWPIERIQETWNRIVAQLPDQARARLSPGLAIFLHDAGHEEAAVEALAATPMDAAMIKRWQRLAPTQRSHYPELFAWLDATVDAEEDRLSLIEYKANQAMRQERPKIDAAPSGAVGFRPLFAYPSDQAVQHKRHNPVSTWGDRGSANRVEPIALPEFDVPFKLEPGESIFTIGSCFARNVETELMRRGFRVPVRDLFKREDFRDMDMNIINNYGTPSIYNEIAWAFGEQIFNPDDHILEVSRGRFVDLHLSSTMRPGSRDAVVRRREAVIEATRSARDCRVVIMTLGLTEVWFDTKTGYHLNIAPMPSLTKAEPDRFQLHVLSYQETFDYLERAILALKKHGRPDLRVVMTVSPIPLDLTYRPIDVMVANSYSKAALRVAAESIVAAYPFVAYFPSYESFVLSDRLRAFRDDMRHATQEMIAINIGRMVSAYCGADYDRERIARDIEAGGAEVAVAQATLAAGASYAADFFAEHGQWSEQSPEFALIHARHLITTKAYAEAIPLLRRLKSARPGLLEPMAMLVEALLRDGHKEEPEAMMQELLSSAPKRSSIFWNTLIDVAIDLKDSDLLLTILPRYSANAPGHAVAAYFRAGRYFRDNKDEARAILLYRESWEHSRRSSTGLELAELLLLGGRQEEASDILRDIQPDSPRQKATLARLNHLASLTEA